MSSLRMPAKLSLPGCATPLDAVTQFAQAAAQLPHTGPHHVHWAAAARRDIRGDAKPGISGLGYSRICMIQSPLP